MEDLASPCSGCMGETVVHSCGMKPLVYETVVERLEKRVRELEQENRELKREVEALREYHENR